jgi:hypothetical protein
MKKKNVKQKEMNLINYKIYLIIISHNYEYTAD